MFLDNLGKGMAEAGWEVFGRTVLRHVAPEDLEGVKERVGAVVRATYDALSRNFQYIRNYTQLQEVYGATEGIDGTDKQSGDARIDAYKAVLLSISNEGIDKFWEILEVLAYQEDLAHIDVNDPLKTLRRNRELLMAIIRVLTPRGGANGGANGDAQSEAQGGAQAGDSDFDQRCGSEVTYDEVGKKINNRKDKVTGGPRVPNRNFKGASLPMTMPFVREFVRECVDYPDQVKLFKKLLQSFSEGANEFCNGKQRAYLTKGAQVGFSLFFDAFYRESGGDFEMVTSDQEYLPMLASVPKDRVKTVRYDKSNPASFGDSLIKKLKTLKSQRKVVFLSSVCRNGRRILTRKLIERIRVECPDVEIWVDGAQDNMSFPEADLVTYSKRMGATGTGMILLGDKYSDESYYEKLRLQAGHPMNGLASLCALLYAQRTRIGNKMQDLLDVEGLWHFSSKGEYMQRTADGMKKKLKRTEFGDYFSVEYCDESGIDPREYWKYGKIISLFRKDDCPKSVKQVAEELKSKGFQIDWFSISDFEDWSEIDPEGFGAGAVPKSAKERLDYFKKVQQFQDAHKDFLFGSIVFPNLKLTLEDATPENYRRQIHYLKTRAREHEFIRIFIDASMAPEDIDSLVEELGRTQFREV